MTGKRLILAVGLLLVTLAFIPGFSSDRVPPSQSHDTEPVSFYAYQYHQDEIFDTNIIVATYNSRGNSNIQLGDYEEAVADHNMALDLA